MWNYNFYVYITTNPIKTVLYVGVTNDLARRLYEHTENKGNKSSFAGKYYCHNLIYFEHFTHIEYAIQREKEIKKWSRKKKMDLIATLNPEWRFLNDEVIEQ
jgi:putative endonuclease